MQVKASTPILQRPRGTRDYLPDEMRIRRQVIEKLREAFELYGYGEVLTPAFEHLELLEAKAGPEVKEQIYWFTDKAGRRLGLRFELTTPIARIVATKPEIPKPIRFYYIAPVWRYEEPQRGRLREFWHAGVELIGSKYIEADAEVIAVMYRALENTGLDDVVVKLGDRRVAEALSDKIGIEPQRRDDFFRAIDKLDKLGVEGVVEWLAKLGLTDSQIELVIDFIMIKGDNEVILNKAKEILSSKSASNAIEELRELISTLTDGYGLPESSLVVDFGIVRGLAYYTSLVYEAVVPSATEVGSVAGGGRYDDLIRLVGGPNLPATGMAIGVERVIEALLIKGKVKREVTNNLVLVVSTSLELYREALRIAEKLRSNGISVQCDVMRRKLSSMLEYANKNNIPYVVIIGPRELKEGKAVLRDMMKREQKVLEISELVNYLSVRLGNK